MFLAAFVFIAYSPTQTHEIIDTSKQIKTHWFIANLLQKMNKFSLTYRRYVIFSKLIKQYE